MEPEQIKVTLSPQGAALLRAARDRHPEMSTTQLVEEALSERFGKEERSSTVRQRTAEEVRAWLDQLASLSDKIPPQPGERFSREMIYQDHDY
jgi:hypothetical protein